MMVRLDARAKHAITSKKAYKISPNQMLRYHYQGFQTWTAEHPSFVELMKVLKRAAPYAEDLTKSQRETLEDENHFKQQTDSGLTVQGLEDFVMIPNFIE